MGGGGVDDGVCGVCGEFRGLRRTDRRKGLLRRRRRRRLHHLRLFLRDLSRFAFAKRGRW